MLVNLTAFGAKAGCWYDNCEESDKFQCESMDRCATVCSQVPTCRWWSHGLEDRVSKCWLRSDRYGRGKRFGFSSGARTCAPSANGTDTADNDTVKSTAEESAAVATAAAE